MSKIDWDTPHIITTSSAFTGIGTDANDILSSYTDYIVYSTDGNEYKICTGDGTIILINTKKNSIKVNGYTITTETIKNAIKKIQEQEEEYDKSRT